MPARTNWKQIYGVSLLAGIGFTMSLFIASLAFGEGEVLNLAKLGIFVASFIAGVGGWFVLSSSGPVEDEVDEHHDEDHDAGTIYLDGTELRTEEEIQEFFKPQQTFEKA